MGAQNCLVLSNLLLELCKIFLKTYLVDKVTPNATWLTYPVSYHGLANVTTPSEVTLAHQLNF